jgi:hypothetical protein
MTRILSRAFLCCSLLLTGTTVLCATFDERLWEKYAEIDSTAVTNRGSLAGVYLEPSRMGAVTTRKPFADIRVVTDRGEEIPWQIVARRPEKRIDELPARMGNLSHSRAGETWLELLLEKRQIHANAVEILTPDADFSRQVQVLGSHDGNSWNSIRQDGVIFDVGRGEKLRSTRVTFPPSRFPHLALKIANGAAPPLAITGVKVLQESISRGETYSIQGKTGNQEMLAASRESSVVVRMSTVFPLDRLLISTADHNFQRSVEVQVKRDGVHWECWAQGTIFNFDTPTIHESHLSIDMPEVATGEFRLVFRNLDSPPLSVTGVIGQGYRRLLIFKQVADRKLYLFWGNPLAQPPRYDLAALVAREKLDDLPMADLGQPRPNVRFAGNSARLPFTERYKHLLSAIVVIVIAGLVFVQYRVFRGVA